MIHLLLIWKIAKFYSYDFFLIVLVYVLNCKFKSPKTFDSITKTNLFYIWFLYRVRWVWTCMDGHFLWNLVVAGIKPRTSRSRRNHEAQPCLSCLQNVKLFIKDDLIRDEPFHFTTAWKAKFWTKSNAITFIFTHGSSSWSYHLCHFQKHPKAKLLNEYN